MTRLLILQHVAAEPRGTLIPLIRERGHRLRYVNFEREPEARPEVDRYDGLIVLGGPMNVADHGQRTHLRTEMQLIERALKQDKPILGICLGAQLLAHVLGAAVRPHHQAEIGWYRLASTPAGRSDPILHPVGESAPVFQWHSHAFDIPLCATHLASTASCENQAFRHGDKAYGFQFHLEADAALVQRWLSSPAYRAELAASGLEHGPRDIARATRRKAASMQTLARAVFSNFLDLVGPASRRLVLSSCL